MQAYLQRECDSIVFFFQAEDGIRDVAVTGVQTCALPISPSNLAALSRRYLWTAFVVTFLALSIGLLEGVGVSLLIPLLSTFTSSFSAAKIGRASCRERV